METEKSKIEGLSIDSEKKMGNIDQKPPFLIDIRPSILDDSTHSQAEIEAIQIRKKIGDLEKIRENLGLSARKMCQLLLVDPSAWNRWTKGKTQVPPHIYRALEWFLLLNDKIPGIDARLFLPKRSFSTSHADAARHLRLKAQLKSNESEMLEFKKQLNEQTHRISLDLREQILLQDKLKHEIQVLRWIAAGAFGLLSILGLFLVYKFFTH